MSLTVKLIRSRKEDDGPPLFRKLARVGKLKLYVTMNESEEASFWLVDGKASSWNWRWTHLRVDPASLAEVRASVRQGARR